MTTSAATDVVWVDDVPADLVAELAPFGGSPVSAARAAGGLGAARVVVTTARLGVPPEVLAELTALEAVSSYGAGFDNVDLDTLRRRGIALSTTPDVLTAAVADAAVALTLDVLRGITAGDRFVRDGRWSEGPFALRRQVTGRHVGIFGLGRIGQAIARRFAGFDCAISYHSRRSVEGVAYPRLESVAALAQACDVLVVAAPGGDETRGAIDAEVLRELGPEGVLVNIARGSIVVEEDLVAALRDGTIAGAGLDVFADEPHVPEGLLDLDNVVLTPHLGSATTDTRRAMAETTAANVRAWLDGRALLTPLDLG